MRSLLTEAGHDETVFKIDGSEDLKQQDGRDDREDRAVSIEHAVVPGR